VTPAKALAYQGRVKTPTIPGDRTTRAGWMLAAVLAGLGVGCSSETAPGAPTFVGTLTGKDAVVGAVAEGDDVSFYVCGGASTYSTMTRWIQGTARADGSLDLLSKGWRVTGNLEVGAGELEGEGVTYSWQVHPSTGPLEGLYETVDSGCRTGAVVGDFGDGVGTRLQGTWCDTSNRFAQVTPIAISPQGIQIDVLTGLSKTLFVTRLAAPLPPP
jgi:hypothetical protein